MAAGKRSTAEWIERMILLLMVRGVDDAAAQAAIAEAAYVLWFKPDRFRG